MSTVRWLHISDIHMNQVGTETENMRNRLLSYLKDKDMHFDYVFFTGDLRYAPAGCYSDDTVSYLNELLNVVGLSADRLFITAGNHDVDREDISRNTSIDKISGRKNGYYSSADGQIRCEDLQAIAESRSEFNALMNDIYKDIPARAELYQDSSHPHFVVETDEFNILHVDSTIIYSANRERDLIIGSYLLKKLIKDINTAKPTVLLTHYSFEYMSREEQKQLVQLLCENNIQLWLAGHEHDDIVRMQRDCFYEFQAGSLVAASNTRCCILTGELNTDTGKGVLTAHHWVSPYGWESFEFINPTGKEKNRYDFYLQLPTEIHAETDNIAASLRKYSINDPDGSIEYSDVSDEDLENIPDSVLNSMKKQLGKSLTGNESKRHIIWSYLNEINTALADEERYDCMPCMRDVPREVMEGHIHVDKVFAPVDKVRIIHRYYQNEDYYSIQGEHYAIEFTTYDNMPAQVGLWYDLSEYSDANDRLLYFKPIQQILQSKKVFITAKPYTTDTLLLTIDTDRFVESNWLETQKMTDIWIEEMERVASIERHFGIKLKLPRKATTDEHIAIEILSDSIQRKRCATYPPVPLGKSFLKRQFAITEEIEIPEGKELPSIKLFGYEFIPKKQYIIPCVMNWNKHIGAWETELGGVPVGVEFEISM